MACVETYSTLRIFSDSMHPDEIEEILGLSATEKRPMDPSSRYRPRRETHAWLLSTKGLVESADNQIHVATIIRLVTPHAEAFRRLQSSGCQTDISNFWISSGQGGPWLDLETMRALCELALPIWWDIYFKDEENPEPGAGAGGNADSRRASG